MMTLNGEPMIPGTYDRLIQTLDASPVGILQHGLNSDCPNVISGEWKFCQGHPRPRGTQIEREISKRASNVLAAAATHAINDTTENDQIVIDAVRLLLKLRMEVRKGEL